MNLAQTINLFCAGTSEGAKKAWDSRGRGKTSKLPEDSKVTPEEWRKLGNAPAEQIGRTTLAYNLKSAVGAIMDQVVANSEDWKDEKNAPYVDKWKEDVRKNWTRGLR